MTEEVKTGSFMAGTENDFFLGSVVDVRLAVFHLNHKMIEFGSWL